VFIISKARSLPRWGSRLAKKQGAAGGAQKADPQEAEGKLKGCVRLRGPRSDGLSGGGGLSFCAMSLCFGTEEKRKEKEQEQGPRKPESFHHPLLSLKIEPLNGDSHTMFAT